MHACRSTLEDPTVLYALCTGQPPFLADTNLGVLRRICDDTPRPVAELNPDVPDWFIAILARLHVKDPAKRYQSAAEVAALLADHRQRLGQPVAASRNGVCETKSPSAARRPVARRGLRRWAAAALLLLPVVGLGLTEATGVTGLVASVLQRDQPTSASPGQLGDPGEEPSQKQVAAQAQGDPQPAGQGQAAQVYPMALFPFEERSGAKDYGAKVSDLLFAKLAARPELFLVDRNELKKTLQEQELNLSGLVQPAAAVRVGQLTGAKILVSGAVVLVDRRLYLTARIVGTETSRVVGAAVDGKVGDDLGPLVEKLAEAVADTIAKQADKLVAAPVARTDRLAELNKKLAKKGKRPVVMVQIPERHVGRVVFDPAAQTEVMRYLKGTGFEVIDPEGGKNRADVVITGEGISELAARHGNLVSVKARVELKAVDLRTDKLLAVDRQTAVVVDLTEQLAGKAALQEAAAQLAERILPQLIELKKADRP